MLKTVGEFSFDGKHVSGPARFMKEVGSAKLDSMTSGTDAGFNAMLACAPKGSDLVTVVLVALQTAFAGWKGLNQTLSSLS